MPLFHPQLDDEVLVDKSVPIAGVNNALPPSAIDSSLAADSENRLTQLDGLNRPRPGIIRLQQPSSSLDSIHHLGNGVFLLNNGSTWWKYDNRSNALSLLGGGPAYALGSQVYSTLANDTLYFSLLPGSALSKYSILGGFGTVTLPTNGPTAKYPTWACNRLVYAYQNVMIISDALAPETFDVVTGSLTVDPQASDVITGLALWQTQRIALFRNGATYVVETGPGLPPPDWELNRVSGTIGTRCHGTIVQTGASADVMFLSETGRGVYRLSQAPGTDQQGVWLPVSMEVQGFIDRINWAACDNARATYWNDLYILSVPLDNSTFNNFCLIYAMTTGKWQGLWCYDLAGIDTAIRDFARDRTDIKNTVLLLATRDGIISRQCYPVEGRWYDQNLDGTHQLYNSRLMSRSFTFGEDINQVRPHSVRLQFLDSEDPVQISVYADREIEIHSKQYETSGALLSLPIAGLPFDLDVEGYLNVPIALLHTGICTELQVELEARGNWVLYQIRAAAFESMPLVAT